MRLCLGCSFTYWVLVIAAFLTVFSPAIAQQDVMFVQTAEELQTAVSSGIRHIIIQNHLDLRTLSADPAASVAGALLVITSKTKSIRGDCAGIELDGVTLDPQATSIGQCILRVNSAVFELSNVASELLLSDVYVRLERTTAEMAAFFPILTINSGSAWVTTSVFRGDRNNCRAVDLGRGQKFHARKSFFVGFEADNSAAVRVAAGARGGFKDCTFNINTATLHGSSVGMDSGAIRDLPAACWFQSCIFSSNTDSQGYAISQTDERAMHYNNRAFQKSVDAENGGLITPEPIDLSKLNMLGFLIANADSYTEIASEQSRLTNLQEVVIDTLDDAVLDVDSGGPGIGPLVGGIAAAIVVTVGAIAVFLVVRRRRQQRHALKHLTEPPINDEDMGRGKHMKHSYSTAGSGSTLRQNLRPFPDQNTHPHQGMRRTGQESGSDGSGFYHNSKDNTLTSVERAALASHQQSYPGYSHNDSAYRTYNSQDKTLTNRSQASFTRVPSYVGGKMDGECLEEALDDIYDRRILFLGRFELYSQVHRRVGGQGIVQPARGRYDEEEYAIKFFLNRHSFEREEALYLREDLRRMMPAVKDIVANNDGTICDMAGRVFPPAIVIERGEPLDEWALRIEPDFPTILTVLCHILARLQQLHSVGIAHRDIKPGNVLWRPKHHSWTLIDFGCAAEIGQTCPLSLSLLYAAPESLQALEAGLKTTVADPATDMWALGVISFELLTASRAFARSMSADDIRAAIAGRAPLPWETHDFRKKSIPELRMLRRSVLSCLNRDSQRRPTSTALLQSWNGLFDQATKGTLTEEPELDGLDALPM